MNVLILVAIYAGITLFAWSVTRWVRQYALNKMILDYPNQRSLHTVPTPRGGGLSIALSVLPAVIVMWYSGLMPLQIAIATGGGGLLVILIGWMDDNRGVAIIWRFLCYIIASIWACYWILSLYGQPLDDEFIQYMFWQYLFWTFALTWMINLYNFMDGSDALAALQAIFAASVAAVLLLASGQTAFAIVLLVMAASCTGFLYWNWPPARIFMGDTGSCFIGFMFGLFAMITSNDGTLSITIWLILLSLFICDTSLTLLKRIFGGERWYIAHRGHAYQLVIQSGLGHKQLIYRVLLIYIIFLLPLSWFAFRFDGYQWEITVFTYCMAAAAWLLIQSRFGRNGNVKHEINTST